MPRQRRIAAASGVYALSGLQGAISTDLQKAQRRAATGISLRHSGHFLLVGSTGAALRAARAFNAFIGATRVKYTAAEISRKAKRAFRNAPYEMTAPCSVTWNAEKSGLPATAEISGVIMLVTNDVTTAPNAAPTTTATARSITLPRIMNSRKPLSMIPPDMLIFLFPHKRNSDVQDTKA